MISQPDLPRARSTNIHGQKRATNARILPCLGTAIRKARRDALLNQSELADAADLCRNAVVAIEGGGGHTATLFALADALQQEVTGRGLSGDGHLGQRMLVLRKRRRLSRRKAAGLAGISIPAIEGIERLGKGHVATLESLGRAINAGLCLVPKGTSPDFWSSAGNSSADVEWYTPAWLLERVVISVGPIDTDPCSPGRGRSAVQARLHLTAEDNGLAHEWPGKVVWLNPPYGRTISLWLEKARREVEARNCRCVVALVPARTDTAWWHSQVAGVADILLLRGRISFGDGNTAAPFPSAILGYGLSVSQRKALFGIFPDAMHVAVPELENSEHISASKEAA